MENVLKKLHKVKTVLTEEPFIKEFKMEYLDLSEVKGLEP